LRQLDKFLLLAIKDMKSGLLFIIFAFLASPTIFAQKQFVQPIDWKLVSECGVKFYIPPDFKEETVKPRDSCAVKYRSDKAVIVLLMSDNVEPGDSLKDAYSDRRDFNYANTKIDGRKAEIIIVFESDPNENGLNYAALLFAPPSANKKESGGGLTLGINSVNKKERKKLMLIYQTVRFPKDSEN
jgi:hypothetical protein